MRNGFLPQFASSTGDAGFRPAFSVLLYQPLRSAVLPCQARQILPASISRTHLASKPRPWRWPLIDLRGTQACGKLLKKAANAARKKGEASSAHRVIRTGAGLVDNAPHACDG
jgi:hypothetical protein